MSILAWCKYLVCFTKILSCARGQGSPTIYLQGRMTGASWPQGCTSSALLILPITAVTDKIYDQNYQYKGHDNYSNVHVWSSSREKRISIFKSSSAPQIITGGPLMSTSNMRILNIKHLSDMIIPNLYLFFHANLYFRAILTWRTS